MRCESCDSCGRRFTCLNAGVPIPQKVQRASILKDTNTTYSDRSQVSAATADKDLFLTEIANLPKAREFCEKLKCDSPAEYGALVSVIKERERLRS